MNYNGKWIKVQDDNMIPGPDQSKVISRMDKMQKIIQSATPQLKGIEAHWKRSMQGKPLIKNVALPYELSIPIFICYCDKIKGKILPQSETGTWIWLRANSFGWFMKEADYLTDGNYPLYLLPKQTSELKGNPVYKEKAQTGPSMRITYTGYEKTVVVFRKGELPYIPVNRKEFLTSFIAYYENQKSMAIKKASNDANKYEKERIDAILRPAKDELEKLGEKGNNIAYMKDGFTEQFRGFATERDGDMVVRLNPTYFKKNLPNYVPQLLVMRYEWNYEKQTINWHDQFEKNLDISELQNMLDK